MDKTFKFRFFGILAFLAMIAAFSAAAMFLWNALMPQVFALPVLSYWQSMGMVILAKIFFGGMGPGRMGMRGFGIARHGNPLREKWLNMSEDERKEFLRDRQGFSRFHEFFNEQSDKGEGGKNG